MSFSVPLTASENCRPYLSKILLNCFMPSMSLDRSVLSILRFYIVITLTQNKQCQEEKKSVFITVQQEFILNSLLLNTPHEGALSRV